MGFTYRISLEDVKSQIPSFLQIIDSTYRGVSYEADFIDLDYNEKFSTRVFKIIKQQSGCRSRVLAHRANQHGKPFNLETFKEVLPLHVTIYENTWQGYYKKAKFHDAEYGEDFEAVCRNFTRKKAQCPARKLAAIRLKMGLDVAEVQNRLDSIYGENFVRLIPDSYKGTGKSARFFVIAKQVELTLTPDAVFAGYLVSSERLKLRLWSKQILARDKCCAISKSEDRLHAHHIKSKSVFPELRFEVSNGIILSKPIHEKFHSVYGKKTATLENLIEFADSYGVDLRPRFA